jgi:toxin ParE1/3/4
MARMLSADLKRRSRPASVADYVLADGVEKELDEIWEFIAKDNPEAATRVIRAAYGTFSVLAENPGLGHPRSFPRKAVRNVRIRTVAGFDKYVVLYRPITNGIEVLHVCNVARNINALMRKKP